MSDSKKKYDEGRAIRAMELFLAKLRDAPRLGSETDDPEGARYIIVSDTLAKDLIAVLVAVKGLLGHWENIND